MEIRILHHQFCILHSHEGRKVSVKKFSGSVILLILIISSHKGFTLRWKCHPR